MSNFKKRNNIKQYRVTGEAGSAPIEDLPKYREELQSLISQYSLEDVYNADETALYWKLEPRKSLARGPVTGVKKPKDRITIMLACNLTGTHKLPAVFLCCIIGIIQHGCNDLYSEIGYQEMRRKRRYILLLLDNVSTHRLDDNEQLSNVKLHC